MKNIGKYMVATLILVGISACSNDSDGLFSSESVEVSRSSELVTVTIDLGTTPGQLQTKLEAELSEVSTLQKLVLTGEFNEADVNYWLNNLKNLVEFDLSGATPKHSVNGDTYEGDGANNAFSGFAFEDNTIGPFFFLALDKLEKITFPANITSIGDKAFLGCTSLASIDIPNTVTSIGSYAFESCNLTSVIVPSTVTSIGESMFANNPNLKSATIEVSNLEIIPYRMFSDCGKLETITIPSSVKEIGQHAFNNCSSLTDYAPFANVTTIQYEAFNECRFETLDLSNVTYAYFGFARCRTVKSVKMNPNMTVISPYMFWACEALTSITLPENLQEIGECAFRATAFETFEIPATVTTIGSGAFEGAKNLKVLTIPATVTEVGGSLINDSKNLAALVWNSTAPVEDAWNINSGCYLYISDENVAVGPNWKNIIVNGVAENVELCANGDRTNSSVSFNVPIPFKAKKITFSRYFGSWTYPGVSSGWQTIVLPFTPTKIEHESKGIVAPFNSGVPNAKPFWLRELTADGFVDKTSIEPNKAYIIAMPNHDSYIEDYRLNGKITFSAENVDLAATPEVLTPSAGPEYSLQPIYNYLERGLSVYTLNIDYWIDGFEYGGVFVRNISDVYAFEAYVTTAGRSARSLYDIDTKSKASRTPYQPNKTGIPQIGDM